MDIQDKTIVVTGGGQGLGRAMAVYLAGHGAKPVLLDLNQQNLDETARLCKKAGNEAQTYLTNVSIEDEVISTFAAIAGEQGPIAGLINNAGVLRDGLLVKVKDGEVVKRLQLTEWQTVIDVNLTGVFLCGREAATHMIQSREGGVIINISSVSRAGNIGQTNYSAAKAGVAAMTVTWAKELARHNIRAGAIAPGFINTDMVASMKPEALEKTTSQTPLRRLGDPNEIAHTAKYIFENDYFTGRIIEIDAGTRM